MKRIAKIISKKLSKYSNVECSEEKITYGLTKVLSFLLWTILLFIFSKPLNVTKETFTVFIIYLLLRRNFGGAHAKTYAMCLLLSTLIPVVLGIISTKITLSIPFIAVIYIFSYATAFIKGVVDNPKKRLTQNEKSKFKKDGLITLTIILIINILCIKYIIISNCIVSGVFWAFINLYFVNK